jgi:hypothetical protein
LIVLLQRRKRRRKALNDLQPQVSVVPAPVYTTQMLPNTYQTHPTAYQPQPNFYTTPGAHPGVVPISSAPTPPPQASASPNHYHSPPSAPDMGPPPIYKQ